MCKKQNNSVFIEKLRQLTKSPIDSLEKAVAIEGYDPDSNENTICFFEDLLNYGCKNGMVFSLIYYHATGTFFDTYYEDIICLKTEYEENTGESMRIPHQVKNHLAWFAFEETARKLWEAE